MFSDNFFKKVEKKTNVNKDTILSDVVPSVLILFFIIMAILYTMFCIFASVFNEKIKYISKKSLFAVKRCRFERDKNSFFHFLLLRYLYYFQVYLVL